MDRTTEELPRLTREQLDRTRAFFEAAGTGRLATSRQFHALLASYYAQMIPPGASVLEIGCGTGELLATLPNRNVTGIDLSPAHIEAARARVPHGRFHVQAGEALAVEGSFDFIIISETVNLAADVQQMFERALAVAHPGTRLILNFYNFLWRPILRAATALGLRAETPESNWLSAPDIRNLLELAGWEQLKLTGRILLPLQIPGLSTLLNRFTAPLAPWLCLTYFALARPRPPRERVREYTVSVVVPARNEAGNIEEIVRRTPELGAGTELIFIEGNSTDDTWQRIQQVAAAHPERNIRIMQQTGRGKGNAVREAFAAATGDMLMILDADITVPPEDLPKFYEAVASRHGEFANGVRLVYPMESQAMQFANLCANKAFGLIFSWLLQQPVKDTLCGTKVLLRSDYERLAANRAFFGDFDPFGDFDLLFGADKLHLKIVDVPIRYRDRTYGSTNIQRWRHGVLLLRMVLFAARKLRFT
jgi:SAM-dependent methyltransferase